MEFMLNGARHWDEDHSCIRAFLLLSWIKTTHPNRLYHYSSLGDISIWAKLLAWEGWRMESGAGEKGLKQRLYERRIRVDLDSWGKISASAFSILCKEKDKLAKQKYRQLRLIFVGTNVGTLQNGIKARYKISATYERISIPPLDPGLHEVYSLKADAQ